MVPRVKKESLLPASNNAYYSAVCRASKCANPTIESIKGFERFVVKSLRREVARKIEALSA